MPRKKMAVKTGNFFRGLIQPPIDYNSLTPAQKNELITEGTMMVNKCSVVNKLYANKGNKQYKEILNPANFVPGCGSLVHIKSVLKKLGVPQRPATNMKFKVVRSYPAKAPRIRGNQEPEGQQLGPPLAPVNSSAKNSKKASRKSSNASNKSSKINLDPAFMSLAEVQELEDILEYDELPEDTVFNHR